MPQADTENPQREPTFTGERFIPHQTDPFLALEHYHRYCFASRFVRGKKILDIGCGEGYGSAFLSQLADVVVGIDRDQAIIDYARKKYSSIPNLTFKVGNCQDAPDDSENFDMAVCFELLEHLNPDDQVRFLNSMRQRLKPDGLLVISSPEKNEYAAAFPVKNEFHKHELTILELKAFLDSFFKHVHLCAQRILSLSTVWQLEGRQRMQFHFHSRKDLLTEIPSNESFSTPLYLIALCSNAPLPENAISESNSFYLDISHSDQTKDFLRWAQQLNLEAQKNRELIQNLQKELEERTTWVQNLPKELEDCNKWALSLQKELEDRSKSVLSLQEELEDRNKWALSLQKELEDRSKRTLSLQEELEDHNQWALSLESELSKIREQLSSSLPYRVLSKLRILPIVWGK